MDFRIVQRLFQVFRRKRLVEMQPEPCRFALCRVFRQTEPAHGDGIRRTPTVLLQLPEQVSAISIWQTHFAQEHVERLFAGGAQRGSHVCDKAPAVRRAAQSKMRGPLVPAATLGSAHPLRWHLGFDGLDAPLAKAHPYTLLTGHRHDVGLFGCFQGETQLAVTTVHGVGHHPRRASACRQCPLD